MCVQSCLTLCNPIDCSPPGSSLHGIVQQEYWSVLSCIPPGYLPDPGTEPTSPAPSALQADSLLLRHQGSPGYMSMWLTLCNPMDCSTPGSSVHRDSPGMNARVGCYAVLQGIFPTQGSNPGLLHCRWILYQLNYQESPVINLQRPY